MEGAEITQPNGSPDPQKLLPPALDIHGYIPVSFPRLPALASSK